MHERSHLPASRRRAIAELRMRADDGVPVVNSRDVAELFGKEHSNILRDVRDIEIPSDLKGSWFRPVTAPDRYGREQPCCACVPTVACLW